MRHSTRSHASRSCGWARRAFNNLTVILRTFALVVLIALSQALSTFAAESSVPPQKVSIAGLNVAIWTPPKNVPGPWPVVLFSHGFHGCNTQSTFLMTALAQAGYAVFAPDHHDAACANFRAWMNRPAAPFAKPDEWNDRTYADRHQDFEKLIDALKADPTYGARPFDWNKLALVGHSLGGYTVLGLSGAWPSWKDSRVRAVVGLSPYSTPFLQSGKLGDIGVPVMYQGGTRDFGITPSVAKPDGVYAQTRPPKYFVEFDGAGHLAWTDFRSTYHTAIAEYTIAFLNCYLKGEPFPSALTEPHTGVTVVRIEK